MIGVRDLVMGVPVPRGTTSSITAIHLVAWLEAQGDDLSAWLADAGISRADLASPDLRVLLPAFDALWARAMARHPAIGLQLIDHFPPGQAHLVAHLALRNATVADAMSAAQRFAALTDPDDRLECLEEGPHLVVRYAHPGLQQGSRQNPGFVEHLFAMIGVLLARGVGRALPVQAVHFAAPQQARTDDYRARFGVLPQFNAGENVLVFDRAMGTWPLVTRDDYLRTLLERLADERMPALPPTLPQQVGEALRRGWLKGRPLDLAAAAAEVGRTPSQLRAQLAQHNTGFRELHDTTRREVARLHLAGTLSLGEIAWLLGFSEPAAFQHAVRRWFGASAGDIRGRLARGEPLQGDASSKR